MRASPFPEFDALLPILRDAGVPHALIGGWAVIAWGFLRVSDDIDFLVGIGPGKPKALLEALSKDFHGEWIPGGIDDPIPGLIRAVPVGGGLPVDLLPARTAADRAALRRARLVAVEGLSIPVVAPEDLIAMKLEAGGGQDYVDARRLCAILAGKIDERLLRQRCTERKVEERLNLLKGP